MISLFSVVYAITSTAVQTDELSQFQLFYYQRNLEKDQIGFSYNKVPFLSKFNVGGEGTEDLPRSVVSLRTPIGRAARVRYYCFPLQ